jgi:hypothetical protein
MSDEEKDKERREKEKNCRDEHFWFTAAAVGYNGVLLGQASTPPPTAQAHWIAICSAALVSLFAAYLVLTRWVAAAGVEPSDPPSAQHDSWYVRAWYTIRLVGRSLLFLPWAIFELSGEHSTSSSS